MSIPILTYHGMNVIRNTYAENDHLALASDLSTLADLDLRIVPLATVVDWHQGRAPGIEVEDCVAITFDDGAWFDYYDLDHPTCGMQRSLFNILRDHQARGFEVHASSFVISSPAARTVLDRTCMIGKAWWGDEWWAEASASGLLAVECHSWDHTHPTLDVVAQKDNVKGDFREIKTFEDCRQQVTRAAEYIETVTGTRPAFYAYPWGQASRYLVEHFMPEQRTAHRFRAAFSIEPRHVSEEDDVWYLPRYVFGRDWKSPEELKSLLRRR